MVFHVMLCILLMLIMLIYILNMIGRLIFGLSLLHNLNHLHGTVIWARKWLVNFKAGKYQLVLFDCSTNSCVIDVKTDVSDLDKKSSFNPLSANFTKWPNTHKQFVGNLPTNFLSVFGHFLGLALKGLR